MTQSDMFGDKPIKPVRTKKAVDERLKDFQNRYGRHLTARVLVILNHEDDNAEIPKNHAYLPFTEAQKRITAMCGVYGMTRTIADSGLVACGGGKFLYMWVVHENSTTRRKE